MKARHAGAGKVLCAALMLAAEAWAQTVPPSAVRIVDGRVASPLTATPGDPARGRDVVLNRDEGGCLLCHTVPAAAGDERMRFMGNLAPPLAGVGARLGPAELRARLVDSTRLNPETIMPAYYRVDGLNRVAARWRGKTLLTAQQIEDVVAWLSTLKESP